MTTAPTPSRADALIREHRENMTISSWASDAVDELGRLQAAERTLQRLGYQDRGGQEWAPPIGQAPDFDLIDSLRSRIAELEASKNARIHKLEMQALDLASENSILKRQEQAELEVRKPLPLPLPLSDDDRLRLRSDVARAIWDVMREHEDRCGHALEDVEPKHQVWDCADAAIRAMKDKP
ncbi:hypothetical protein ACUTR7_00230 [Delftia sp. NA_296.1]|uniref:hypothetical protein n=1 Tax=Delftia sp. NA_296.1 TaxID=3415648 RepID=UPI0040452C18